MRDIASVTKYNIPLGCAIPGGNIQQLRKCDMFFARLIELKQFNVCHGNGKSVMTLINEQAGGAPFACAEAVHVTNSPILWMRPSQIIPDF